ncbi:MAG: hypothetical protein JNM74_22620, partial [Myxococcales bacterium]|nr:hypothetical protein [Myxococcales bacterium]
MNQKKLARHTAKPPPNDSGEGFVVEGRPLQTLRPGWALAPKGLPGALTSEEMSDQKPRP